MLAYIEDFKSERADRERAQSKIMDLQDEVARLQTQIRAQASGLASSLQKKIMINDESNNFNNAHISCLVIKLKFT